jgi:hypothetical protein
MNIHGVFTNLKKQEEKMNFREKKMVQIHKQSINTNPYTKSKLVNEEKITLISPPKKNTPNIPLIKSPIITPMNSLFQLPIVSYIEKGIYIEKLKEKKEMIEEQKKLIQKHIQLLEYNTIKDKILINVYQPVYKFGELATGLGDFIRGTYFLIQFCEENNYKYDVIMNHPVSRYLKNMQLKNTVEKYPNISVDTFNNLLQNIVKFQQSNFIPNILNDNTIHSKNETSIFRDFWMSYLKKTHTIGNKTLIYTISYPMMNLPILEEHRLFIQYMMEGTEEVMKEVESILDYSKLEKKNYTIIHLRCGDSYLIPGYKKTNNLLHWKENPNILFSRIKEEFKKFYNPYSKYFLIADNNLIKREITYMFPFIKTWYHEIAHMGEGVISKDSTLKNNIVDFHMIANSNKVLSYSVYVHGSGFSKWCAETYNIPYTCTYLN